MSDQEWQDAAVRAIVAADRPATEPRTEAACPKCGHDVDHTTACPAGCPKCASPRQRFIDNVLMGGVTTDDREWLNRALDEIVEAEAAQGAAPRAEGLRHYPNDNCGDPDHDRILEAWYARAEALLTAPPATEPRTEAVQEFAESFWNWLDANPLIREAFIEEGWRHGAGEAEAAQGAAPLDEKCGCQCHGPYVWDICSHCRPDILPKRRPEVAAPRAEGLERDAHVCRTCDGLHYHDEAAPRAEGLDVEGALEWAMKHLDYRLIHDPKCSPTTCICGYDKAQSILTALSRPSDERVPESEET